MVFVIRQIEHRANTTMTKRHSRPDCIRSLSKLWNTRYTEEPYLHSVTIYDSTQLRGISTGILKVEFPVSVICGENGSGKTTFLSLAILGFHASKLPLTPLRNIEYFDFNYFFRSTVKDRHDQGIQVGWKYTDDSEDRIEKGHQRWLRYIRNNGQPKRPVRGTEFIGISRITPAFEKKNYHSYFSKKGNFKERDRGNNLKRYVSRIMSKSYVALSELTHSNTAGTHAVHNYNDTHTSFNAGAGEECLSNIVGTLLDCPEGSIVAIEEIEIGLHPSTLPKLSDAILEIALNRKLQILITSHSAEFLRAFPKEGLILATRVDGEVEFMNQPNVEYAISRIGGNHSSAASILCEDKTAGKLISSALPARVRSVCPVIGFGGKDELIEKAKTIKKFSPSETILIVWDGAADESYVEQAESNGFTGLRLPGNQEPEDYLISKLNTANGKAFLKKEFGLTASELHTLSGRINSLEDCHDLPFVLAECLKMPESEDSIIEAAARFVAANFADEFAELVTRINKVAG